MYSFYYVEGISQTDSPLFNSLAEQTQWFNKHVIKSVDDYYPPNYTNSIRVDSDDLTILSKCNYFSLTYNNKIYYYFITGVEYINEAVVNINVEMDTIQTYMFDIKYNNARISRRTIKRWNKDGSINRDYIRENFSNGIYRIKDYNRINTNMSYICLAFQDGYDTGYVSSPIQANVFINKGYAKDRNDLYINGCSYVFIPFVLFNNSLTFDKITRIKYVSKFNDNTYEKEIGYNTFVDKLVSLLENPGVLFSFFIPFQIFDNVEVAVNNNIVTITSDATNATNDTEDLDKSLGEFFNPMLDNDSELSITLQVLHNANSQNNYDRPFPFKYNRKIYSLPFNKNSSAVATFDYRYVPALIDENYIKFQFGMRSKITEFPTSKLSNVDLYCVYSCDILTGNYNFAIYDNTETEDIYFTRINIESESFMLFNSPWRNFKANNSVGMYLKPALDLMGASTPYVDYGTEYSHKYNYSRKYKNRITSEKTNVDSYFKVGGLKGIANAVGTISDYVDLANAPKSLKQYSEISANLSINNYDIIELLTTCTNLEAVATIYESVGYAQDEFVVGSPIFNDRQIYNYIECSDIDLHLNVLTTSEIVDNISNRYYNGIRYWNVTTMETLNLNLGDVCVYDNVEVVENE